MTRMAIVRAWVESGLKRQAEELFSEMGLSTTEAMTLFFKQATIHRGLPFSVTMPNAETVEALQQARDGGQLTEHAGLDALKAKLD